MKTKTIRTNLRTRFIIAFGVYALVIIGIFTLVVIVIERKLANEFFFRRLAVEMDYFVARYGRDPHTPLPNAEDITSYLELETIPEPMRSMVSDYSDGIYSKDTDELHSFRSASSPWQNARFESIHDLFFGVKTLPDGKRIFIFIDFNFWHTKQQHLEIHLFWAFLITGLVGIIIGLFTGNRVLSPLRRLMGLIEKSEPENLPSGFSQMFKNDEFGALARAFESSFQRVRQFIKREHQFTRDASHELRTPVTVIKGAVELLQMTPTAGDPLSQKLVKRIERSVADMETTIESLLWLAREVNPNVSTPDTELSPLVQKAIAQNQHLIAGKAVEISFTATDNPTIAAPAGVVLIAITNLIRNACQYTLKGFIKITVTSDRLEVADSGPGIAETQRSQTDSTSRPETGYLGFGYGLEIVNRICERFGWQLQITGRPEQGTTAVLVFKHDTSIR